MQHCTPETLALAALREPLASDDAAHLDGCADCRSEVTSLQRSVDALAVPEFAASVAPLAPPSSVWAGIAAATGVSTAPRFVDGPAVVAVPEPQREPAPEPAPLPVPEEPAPAVVRELRPRRSRVVLAVAASLVAGAAIGAGAVALADRDARQEVAAPPTTPAPEGRGVAATPLSPLDDRDASGNAEVVATGDGEQLRVQLDAPDAGEDFYEVWLIEPSIERMVQIGVVRPGTTVLDLPRGIDLAEYPIVDVSVEPLDGDPTHSGDSVARGILET